MSDITCLFSQHSTDAATAQAAARRAKRTCKSAHQNIAKNALYKSQTMKADYLANIVAAVVLREAYVTNRIFEKVQLLKFGANGF
jgi:hypothetical protein